MYIRAEIVRWIEDEAPTAESRFTDALGVTHAFVGHPGDFTSAPLDAASDYPLAGTIPCEVLARRLVEGRELVQVDTEVEGGGLMSTEGLSWFMIVPEEVVEFGKLSP